MMRIFLCEARRQIRPTRKSEMIEEILCQAKQRNRSLLGVNEDFAVCRLVQNLPIRMIFKQKRCALIEHTFEQKS